jgi:hypothetical protein
MALLNRRQRFNLTNPQYLLAQALQKGIPTGPARGGWTEGLSRLGQAFIAKQARDEANTEFKADEINRQATLEQAFRAGRGFTNPDDTFVQLKQPLNPNLPISQQPNARTVPTPRAPSSNPDVLGQKIPSMAGGRQAMAEVLMGSGRDDLMAMGIKMDPRFRDPLTSRPGTAIQYNNELNRLIQTYGKDSAQVKQFKQVMKIGQPKFFQQGQGVVSVPTSGSGEVEVVSPAQLAPKDRPKNIEAGERAKLRTQGIMKRTEGRLDEGRAAAEMLPVLRRSIALLEDIPTGGIDKFKMRIKTFFGVESADEGELAQNLGKAVLSQLRKTFGAQFTEREGERLNKIEANFGKSPESNIRQLKNLLAFNEEFYRQGVVAAGDLEDEAALESLRGLNKVRLGLDEGLPEVEQPPVQPQVSPSPDDDAARAWLQANPDDPRANDVRDRLGIPRGER